MTKAPSSWVKIGLLSIGFCVMAGLSYGLLYGFGFTDSWVGLLALFNATVCSLFGFLLFAVGKGKFTPAFAAVVSVAICLGLVGLLARMRSAHTLPHGNPALGTAPIRSPEASQIQLAHPRGYMRINNMDPNGNAIH